MTLAAARISDRPEPDKNCLLCPRLVAFRNDNRIAHPDWFNGAVPSFGSDTARLLIVGLAPGLKGANRAGRPFLGDYAGELLYRTLLKFGLARGRHDPAAPGDLELVDAQNRTFVLDPIATTRLDVAWGVPIQPSLVFALTQNTSAPASTRSLTRNPALASTPTACRYG